MGSRTEEAVLNRDLPSLPSSRELGTLLQYELASATGMAARWTAERVQGNLAGMARWTVPFVSEQGLEGRFVLRWNPALAQHLGNRMGASAARPEFMGSVLRSTAGRWAASQAVQGLKALRLKPSPDNESELQPLQRPVTSSAALLLDGHVLEVVFELDQAPA
jgi:hypothetical protein